MADKIRLTQDLKLPPGVVVTPDHEVPEPLGTRPRVSDRLIAVDGTPQDLGAAEHLSTYRYERQPVAPVDQDALPRESVNEANAAPSKK